MPHKTSVFFTVFGIVTAVKYDKDWTYYTSIIMAAGVCYAVTYFRDQNDVNRLDWKYTLSCSIAASYLAYYLYPNMQNVEFDLIVWKVKPFNTIQVFVGICSFFGLTIFKEANEIKNFGWRTWFGKVGNVFKAVDKKS